MQCIACGVDCVWIFEGKPLGRLLVQMCSFQQVIHQISEMSELSRPSGFIQADPPVSDGKQNPGSSLCSSSLQALTALLSRECRQGGLSLYSSYNVQAHTSQLSLETKVKFHSKMEAKELPGLLKKKIRSLVILNFSCTDQVYTFEDWTRFKLAYDVNVIYSADQPFRHFTQRGKITVPQAAKTWVLRLCHWKKKYKNHHILQPLSDIMVSCKQHSLHTQCKWWFSDTLIGGQPQALYHTPHKRARKGWPFDEINYHGLFTVHGPFPWKVWVALDSAQFGKEVCILKFMCFSAQNELKIRDTELFSASISVLLRCDRGVKFL